MLDIKYIRSHSAAIKQAAQDKNVTCDVDQLLKLDEQRRNSQKQLDDLRSQQTTASTAIAQTTGAAKQTQIQAMKVVSEQIKELEKTFTTIEAQFNDAMLYVPNVPAPSVPIGKDENDNVELKKVGEPKQFDFTPQDHLTLGQALDIIDVERGVKVTGNRGYYLKGLGAQLEMALMLYGLDFLRQRGFTQFVTPLMAQPEFFYGTGHFPWNQSETFKAVDKEREQYLIGSSEITLCAYHANETLAVTDLPKRYTAWTPCFRTEVGSYGKDTKGLYRLRQFNKVEQVILCVNDDTAAMNLFEEIIKNSEEFLQSLGLAYRVVELCTGEMGAPQKYKRDIETWMPSRQKYSETHSCSWLGDFQARRLNIRYRSAAGKVEYCQTLNNTLVASPRVLIPLLETYQTKDGSVMIPEVLRPYLGNIEKISPNHG